MRIFSIVLLVLTCCFAQGPPRRVQRLQALTRYPVLARAARIQGIVKLRCTLDADGRVTEIKTLSGHALLAAAATRSVERWTFDKAAQESNASNTVDLEFSFELREPGTSFDDTQFIFEYPNRVRVVTSVSVLMVSDSSRAHGSERPRGGP